MQNLSTSNQEAERDALEYGLRDEELPAEGYQSGGQSLYNQLTNSARDGPQSVAWYQAERRLLRWESRLVLTLVSIIVTVMFASWLGLVGIVVSVVELLATGVASLWGHAYGTRIIISILALSLFVFAALRAVEFGQETLRARHAKAQHSLAKYLRVGGTESPVSYVSTPDLLAHDRLRADFEEIGVECDLRDASFSVAELLGGTATEPGKNLHIAEYTTSSRRSSIITQSGDEPQPGATLPLDAIARHSQDLAIPCVVQILIRPRQGDHTELRSRMAALRQGQPEEPLQRLVANGIDTVRGEETHGTDSRMAIEELDETAKRRYEGMENTDGHHTFGVTVRAVCYDSSGDHAEDATQAFETIETALDSATNDETSIKMDINLATTGDTDRRRAALGRFVNEQHWTPRPRRGWLWGQANHEFVVDSTEVWNYLLRSTKSGAGSKWRQGAPPRDRQPTAQPPGEGLEPFRATATGHTEDD